MTTLTEAYATSTESDSYLANKADWIALTDAVKDDALLWGRYFIDINYKCDFTDVIPEEVKYANSLLGYDYFIQGDLFFDNTSSSVKKKMVKAGKVETEKEFFTASKKITESSTKVKAILLGVCTKANGSTVSLTRV